MQIPEPLIQKLESLKTQMTYEGLSKALDVPVPTLYRWRNTKRMNRFYVKLLTSRLLQQTP